jgi:hypothetical protein
MSGPFCKNRPGRDLLRKINPKYPTWTSRNQILPLKHKGTKFFLVSLCLGGQKSFAFFTKIQLVIE